VALPGRGRGGCPSPYLRPTFAFLPPPADPRKSSSFSFWGPCAPLRPLLLLFGVLVCLCARFATAFVEFCLLHGPILIKMNPSWSPPSAPELRISQQNHGFAWFRRLTQKVVRMLPKGAERDPKRPPKLPKATPRDLKVVPGAPSVVRLALWGGLWAHFGFEMGALGSPLGPFVGTWTPPGSSLAAPGDFWSPKWSEKRPFGGIWGMIWGGFQEAFERKFPRIALGSAARP